MSLDTLNLTKETKKEIFIDSINLSDALEDCDLKRESLLALVSILQTKKFDTMLATVMDDGDSLDDCYKMNAIDIYDTLADISASAQINSGISYIDIADGIECGDPDFTCVYFRDVNTLLRHGKMCSSGIYKCAKIILSSPFLCDFVDDDLLEEWGIDIDQLLDIDINDLATIIQDVSDSIIDIMERKFAGENPFELS